VAAVEVNVPAARADHRAPVVPGTERGDCFTRPPPPPLLLMLLYALDIGGSGAEAKKLSLLK